ncbi:pre-mRNA 3'-end-processing factor FIP1 isoform X2 [Copidosoma floridanum]|uniref:pre-mRNA 3'-end-processing factor FIP1 isoform X2 n=1 Tax=Copidosoma floridanum TaxID=29053 RepID=UPI000C6FB621|nr:pre-mRNA 3'-end-processing factor FIP1 isoform X2 [Copidosoma floridanum]
MADENEDQWLYGDSQDAKDGFPENSDSQPLAENDVSYSSQDKSYQRNESTREDMDNQTPGVRESLEDGGDTTTEDNFDRNNESERVQQNNQDEDSMTNDAKQNGTNEQTQDEGDRETDSESDDDVEVHIGDIKSTPAQQQYSSLNIKRGGLLNTAAPGSDKHKQQPGKFSLDEFETIGSINGIPAHEFNLDQLEDKPWRQPGADITDFFNYGFNEDTWRAYCERQKRMRSESGVGLILNTGTGPPGVVPGNPGARVPQVTITNYNSKYSGISGPKRAGPPPGRKMAGTIDVIGSSGLGSRRNLDKSPPKENVIQVMTADRREYSRKPPGGFPDMSVPPPPAPRIPATFDMPPPGYQEPPPYFLPELDPYYQSYEPTQDRQWNTDTGWQPTNVNIPLTGDDRKNPGSKTHMSMVPPSVPPMMPRDMRDRHSDRDRERRDRDRDYEEAMMRERERDRDRERHSDREKESRREDRDVDSSVREEDRDRDRSRSQYRHKERHRHRSRSRSRRHKSRSRSPSKRKKKSRRSEREKSKEDSE